MEVKLWKDKLEREEIMYDNFAQLFAIVKATEAYYVRHIISPHDYDSDCLNLVAHFNILAASTLEDSSVPNNHHFADTYGIDSPAAINQAAFVAFESSSAAIVAQCVQNFITAMDSLKLNMVAVDKVKTKMKEWIARLVKMGAADDQLTKQQARQLHFDLESSYCSFMAALPYLVLVHD